MENSARQIWIRFNGVAADQEERVLALLENGSWSVIDADQLGTEPVENAGLVVVNATQSLVDIGPVLTTLVERAPLAKLLVRCGISEEAVRTLAPFRSAGLLDSEEGPDLTRARILRAISEGAGRPLARLRQPEWRRSLIGRSHAIEKVAEVIRLVGPRRCTVLITGETGTGKEVAAKAIHGAGPRSAAPFSALNCGAVPAALLEAELFGHTRGAFTGAVQVRTGRFEQAHGGTLFLDEIGDLPLELQAKLLRVLQEREIQKLGSSETIRVDVRIVAATNCDLRAKVEEGTFREDLYYRLNVVPLELPPLRGRPSDVRPLAEHFLAKVCAEEQLAPKRLTPRAWEALEQYGWPGNVRQLENAISSAVILSEDRPYLDVADFSLPSIQRMPVRTELLGMVELPDHGLDFTRTVNHLERALLAQALQKTKGNKKAAAEMLRLKRTTLAAKVRVLELQEGAA